MKTRNFLRGYRQGYMRGLQRNKQKQKHGAWLSNYARGTVECSVCHFNIMSEKVATPYCPECGAQMDGGLDE